MTFLNQLQLISQCPNVTEIFTNNEPSNARSTMIGNQKVILRRARATVNRSNAPVLSFLEMMNTVSPQSLDEDKKAVIEKYIADNRIGRKDMRMYAPLFPDKAIRTLVESALIYSVAQ